MDLVRDQVALILNVAWVPKAESRRYKYAYNSKIPFARSIATAYELCI